MSQTSHLKRSKPWPFYKPAEFVKDCRDYGPVPAEIFKMDWVSGPYRSPLWCHWPGYYYTGILISKEYFIEGFSIG